MNLWNLSKERMPLAGAGLTLGIIANPEAGRDVRRLVTESSVVTSQEKMGHLRRLLVGIGAAGRLPVLLAEDLEALPRRALDGIGKDRLPDLDVRDLAYELTGTSADTTRGAELLVESGAGILVTVGGDGTNRLVHGAVPDVPLVPLSTGTNNAFPLWMEATTLGLAAGLAARFGLTEEPFVKRLMRLVVEGPFGREIALVDLAVLAPTRRGRAVWNATDLAELFLTRAEPTAIGLSSIGGWTLPLAAGSAEGRHLTFTDDSGTLVSAPIGPGRFETFSVGRIEPLLSGGRVRVEGPASLAFDGEPLHVLAAGHEAHIHIERGPLVINPGAVLAWAATEGKRLTGRDN